LVLVSGWVSTTGSLLVSAKSCDECCSYGNCTRAFKGQEGKCCGLDLTGKSYCCPWNAYCQKDGDLFKCSTKLDTSCDACCRGDGSCDRAFNDQKGECCGRRDGVSYCCNSKSQCIKSMSGWECQFQSDSPLIQGDGSCDSCCSKGGSCLQAFQGKEGVCCGRNEGVPYCCPVESAHCVASGRGFPCKAVTSKKNSRVGLIIGIIVAAVVAVCICTLCYSFYKRETNNDSNNLPTTSPPYGGAAPAYSYPTTSAVPVAYSYPTAVNTGYSGTAVNTGYAGTTVAGAAGAGFLGGMLVEDALSHHRHDYGAEPVYTTADSGYSSGAVFAADTSFGSSRGGGGGVDQGGSSFAADTGDGTFSADS